MVPPPPSSQAGKFKPRKPAKKISVGGGAAPDNVPSTAAVIPTENRQRQGRGGRGGRGERGGGRGRGRSAIPQGRAFFTAQPPPQQISARGINSRSQLQPAATTSLETNQTQPAPSLHQQKQARQRQDGSNNDIDDEEVVGTLDQEIGYNSLNDSSNNKNIDNIGTSQDKGTTATTNFERTLLGKNNNSHMSSSNGPNGYMYDSDSSDEGNVAFANGTSIYKNVGTQRPITLPFPSENEDKTRSYTNAALDIPANAEETIKNPSNILNMDESKWLLVQLPTRLPPVVSNDTNASNGNSAISESNSMHNDPEVRIVEPSAVATSPIQRNAFDNVLQDSKPGRIGRLKVYRSGKMTLELDSPDDDRGGPVSCLDLKKFFFHF
jgi:hypothetical protein